MVDNRDRIGALVSRALAQGFEFVHVGGAGGTLRAGYAAGGPALELKIDLERLEADPVYFGELITAIGRVPIGAAGELEADMEPWPEIEVVAREYLRLAKLSTRLDALKKELIERMPLEGRTAIDVAGLGAVVFVPASTRRDFDREAVKILLLGVVPMKTSPIAAHIKPVWAS